MAIMTTNVKNQDNDISDDRGRGRPLAQIDEVTGYIINIEDIKRSEYPNLHETTYLDHAGTTPYAKSLIESHTAELTSNLFGNPHSASASSQLSTRRIDDIRLQVLRYFNADPDDFDVVFVANATAAIKLVADSFRDSETGFWYGYHGDAHTSLVGVREVATNGSRCFQTQAEIDEWLLGLRRESGSTQYPILFAYPGQSNMTGERHSVDICTRIRDVSKHTRQALYSLYDAAAILSTSPLNFSDAQRAPDFTALSFYKIFGYPDLGALLIRKASGNILRRRKYFAGGTVEMVSARDMTWHEKKQTLHSALEDGTLPFHNIIALEHAIKTHARIYGSMSNISRHTRYLAAILFKTLEDLKHGNGQAVCEIYSNPPSSASSGATIAFNLLDGSTKWISNAEVEKLAIIKGIQLRIGGLCNPGGIAQHLHLSTEEMKQNFASGQRCGGGNDIMNGKPTGAIRVSLGAMSSLADVEKFISFLEEFYVDHDRPGKKQASTASCRIPRYFIESLSVFPIKSCGAFKVPSDTNWPVSLRGLAWDREWCLVHQGTNIALSQKQYPSMALLQPTIDLDERALVVTHPTTGSISISLDDYPGLLARFQTCSRFKRHSSMVCGQSVPINLYTSSSISSFFTTALGVPCTLARHPTSAPPRFANIRRPKSAIPSLHSSAMKEPTNINLSNESPILLVSRSSVNHLNSQIRKYHPSAPTITPSTFRANIVISQTRPSSIPSPSSESNPESITETPYLEDNFISLTVTNSSSNNKTTPIRTSKFQSLGPCQRCQMVCVDQTSGKRSSEPFSTLAKTRRKDGGVWFGVHLCLHDEGGAEGDEINPDGGGERYVRIGDEVSPQLADQDGDGDGDGGKEDEQIECSE